MKILIMAYSCGPDDGGEPSVGWHWTVGALASGHTVHLVTRLNNRPAIEAGRRTLTRDLDARLVVHYHDLGHILITIKKRLPMFGVMFYYVLWQLRAIRLVRRLSKAHDIDFAHHVTFCNDAVFSACAFAGVPFVWGPIGGWSHTFPKGYRSILDRRAKSYEAVRRVMQLTFGVLDPMCWLTRRRATVGVYYSREACEGTRPLLRPRNATAVRHVGIAAHEFAAEPSARKPGESLRLISVGRLVHWKGFDLTLRALALAREPGSDAISLDIIGTGDQRARLERLTRDLGLEDVVRFHGRVAEHSDVGDLVRRSHVFVQPTLRDGPPVAMMEAMSSGVPVLAAAFGAVPELVPAEAGRIVRGADGPDALVAGLAAELRRFERDEALRYQLGVGALAYARDALTWDVVAEAQRQLYATMQARLAARTEDR